MSEKHNHTNPTGLFSGSVEYLESLYEDYQADTPELADDWKGDFQTLEATVDQQIGPPAAGKPSMDGYVSKDDIRKQAAVQRLIRRYQVYGHLNARLDPLGLSDSFFTADLSLEVVGLTESDLNEKFKFDAVEDSASMPLSKILKFYEQTYCGSIGYEYMHITDPTRLEWIQSRVEKSDMRKAITDSDRENILNLLTMAECMETYLHMKYVGQKRFSLEGGESLIPMLNELVNLSGESGSKEVVIGMAHRGRLNVLVNILGKSPAEVFGEFEGNLPVSDEYMTAHGDVKYHQGFSADINTPGGIVHVALAFNPSHLEIINPVVEGSVRARQHRRRDKDRIEVTPVLIHGDAALAGQGVVMETLNMSHTRGFNIGGTIHIVINNQIGFTTSNQLDARSTVYCTEIAKMVQAPIFHVNGDDPEAVIAAVRHAHAYRMKFHTDVVIDMVCYRRYGHNEADEPMMTQPVMYDAIKKIEPVRRKYAAELDARGVVSSVQSQKMIQDYRDNLDRGEVVVGQIIDPAKTEKMVDWSRFISSKWSDPVDTTVTLKKIAELTKSALELPENFVLHNRVRKIMDDRMKMAAGKLPIDWGFAETTAYATLIDDGVPIRLTGEDVGRGTFSHRHALLHDQNSRDVHCPLKSVRKQEDCQLFNSLLSEEAVLAFEYGYATTDPETLVLWEAQFGDFVNGAQIVIDQFISSGFAKWARFCGLVLLLPHGYEGQGPEHSSARLERFLQMCAGDNMQICVPTTPAQMFHLLRRQAIRPYRRPLIVMSPKSLLRHKRSVSDVKDLTRFGFQNVIDEVDENIDRESVVRLILCAGKVYFDLLEMREHLGIQDTAIARIEQLYPFPTSELNFLLQSYTNATDIVWCQEEPKNQGAWYQIWHRLNACLTKNQNLTSASREAAPSPAVGNYRVHLAQQERLITKALTVNKPSVSSSQKRGVTADAS
ncbi:MAG: 2-oxoglutarate dehydrogenase E1 component [Acidiferrobacterales bacterium]|nr:2-oxoglutarate dehydrogenase E1 component [Acidiferrobacterales bacterium]